MNRLLTDEEIVVIAKQYDGNPKTVEFWFARSIESTILNKLNSAEPIATIDYKAPYGIAFTLKGSQIKDGTKLFTHPPAPSAVEGYQLVPIEPTAAMVEAGANVDPERESVWDAMLAAARSDE